MPKPTGKVTVTGFIPRDSFNDVSVYAVLLCTDANGVQWEYHAPYFVGDLEPHSPSQHLRCFAYRGEVNRLLGWCSQPLDDSWLEEQYRQGVSCEDAAAFVRAYESAMRQNQYFDFEANQKLKRRGTK